MLDGFREEVTDAVEGLGPGGIKIGKLDAFRIFEELVAVPNMAVVSRHAVKR